MCLILIRVSPRKPTFSRSRLMTVMFKLQTLVNLVLVTYLSLQDRKRQVKACVKK